MNDEEKSVVLAGIVGWKLSPDARTARINGEDNCDDIPLNLYSRGSMHLAWLVLNWAHDYAFDPDVPDEKADLMYRTVEDLFGSESFWGRPPHEAQRAWLDAVLSVVAPSNV